MCLFYRRPFCVSELTKTKITSERLSISSESRVWIRRVSYSLDNSLVVDRVKEPPFARSCNLSTLTYWYEIYPAWAPRLSLYDDLTTLLDATERKMVAIGILKNCVKGKPLFLMPQHRRLKRCENHTSIHLSHASIHTRFSMDCFSRGRLAGGFTTTATSYGGRGQSRCEETSLWLCQRHAYSSRQGSLAISNAARNRLKLLSR